MIKAKTGLDIKEVFAAGGVISQSFGGFEERAEQVLMARAVQKAFAEGCLLYTSPSPRDRTRSRMPSSA